MEGLCRLCGRDEGIMVNIFEPGTERLKKINKTLPITVSEYDPLPKKLCHHCLNKVNIFFEFRTTVIRSQELFKSMVPWLRNKTLQSKAEKFQMVKVVLDLVNAVSSDEEISPIPSNSNEIKSSNDLSEDTAVVIEDSLRHMLHVEQFNSQTCGANTNENKEHKKKSKRSKRSLSSDKKKRKKRRHQSCQIVEVFSTSEQAYQNLNNIENMENVQNPFDSGSNLCDINSPKRDVSVVEKGILTDDKGGDNIALPKYMIITKNIPGLGSIYTCEKCGVSLLSPQAAVQHHCRGLQLEEDRQKGEPQHCDKERERDKDFYQCSECGHVFTRHSQLAFHMKKHNQNESSSSDDNYKPKCNRRKKTKRHKKNLLCTSNANNNKMVNAVELGMQPICPTSHNSSGVFETSQNRFLLRISGVEQNITRHSLLSSDSE